MRILLYPHDLDLGGSQLNAIEIASGLVDLGHDVIVYGQPGSLLGRMAELGLPFRQSPTPGRRPSGRVIADLVKVVREERIDVLHAYEWPPALECHLAGRRVGKPVVTTVMSMSVAPFLPRDMSLIVGTEQIAAAERRTGRRRVHVLEPPVDLASNHPGLAPGLDDFRARWLRDARPTAVVVSRLVPTLKLEGLLVAIDAIGRVAARRPARLLIAGDGPAGDVVAARARVVNDTCGEGTVVLTGELLDPRAAYASADVAIGMGGSALRALAYGKPLVVQGERGFFSLLDEHTLPDFLWTGWYGVGDGTDPTEALANTLLELFSDAEARERLGGLGLSLVQSRFALTAAAQRQQEILEEALHASPSRPARVVVDDLRSAAGFTQRFVRRRLDRLRGADVSEDANASPVAATALTPAEPRQSGTVDVGAWVWHPGVSWSDMAGTDRRLVEALAQWRPVVWVDPPLSPRHWRADRSVVEPPDGIVLVQPLGPLGPTRDGVRRVTGWIARKAARDALRRHGLRAEAVLVSSPYHLLSPTSDVPQFYYETDDFVAGAELMGVTGAALASIRSTNIARADAVLAITPELLTLLGAGSRGHVLPNGVVAAAFATAVPRPRPRDGSPVVAGLFGQLNDRIDFDVLQGLVDAGVHLLIVGPLIERSTEAVRRMEALADSPAVTWLGARPFAELPTLMSRVDVGITPYVTSTFNVASQPLKTWEYLEAGLPVVSSDLPSARRLLSPDVLVAAGSADFVSAVMRAAALGNDPESVARRRALSRTNDWSARASTLLKILEDVSAHRRGLLDR